MINKTIKYDVIIVGAGPAGYFSAYELMKKQPSLKVLLIDRGPDIYHRKCPVLNGLIKTCPMDAHGNFSCKPTCSMTSGFGGSGAYSDGKFNITSEFGGWMTEILPSNEVLDLIKYVDKINLEHGAPVELTDPYTEDVKKIEKLAIADRTRPDSSLPSQSRSSGSMVVRSTRRQASAARGLSPSTFQAA